ncbi:MAG: HAD-IIA family hydrolase [Actinobacteria bacterium]|nr:HAD-IIA family hydrolase [Actinomycetota bacterium]
MSESAVALLGAGRYRTVLFDLDGTVYIDGKALPGVPAFVEEARRAGHRVGFLTNMSYRSREWCLDVLHQVQVEAKPDELITTVDVMVEVLRSRGMKKVAAIGSDEFRSQLSRAGVQVGDLLAGPIHDPDALVVGMWPGASRESIAAAVGLISNAVPVFATSGVGSLPTSNGLVSGAAGIVRRLREGSGMPVTITGKPGRLFSDVVKRRLDLVDPVLVVGDTIEVDIVMADSNGWDSLLVLTGASSDHQAQAMTGGGGPTYVARTLDDVEM